MWDLRLHPNVTKAFATLWGVSPNDLLTSFDGLYDRPPGETFTLPWHIDHNDKHSTADMTSVQGLLALSDVNWDTGGTQLLPGSHRRAAELLERVGPSREEWAFTEVPEDDALLTHSGRCAVQPQLAAGDLLVWDSRTAHRVVAGFDPCSSRCTAYLSMVPRCFASERVCRERRHGFRDGVATTHWVQRFVDRGGARCRPPPAVVRDRRVRQMVG